MPNRMVCGFIHEWALLELWNMVIPPLVDTCRMKWKQLFYEFMGNIDKENVG